MERYTTIAGEVLEYETLSPEVARFLARVFDAANDPRVTEAAMIDLVYGRENPILRQDILPNHGVVTKEVFADPVYHVMTDLLGRKRVQMGTLDPERALDEYTVTISEAAKRLGVHVSAVRQAVHAHRIDAVKRGGVWLIKPSSVESYKVARRGPGASAAASLKDAWPSLVASVGNVPGRSFRFRIHGGQLRETSREGKRIEGEVDAFDRVAIIAVDKAKDTIRYFELEPDEEDNDLGFGPFWVRGRFRVVRKENNPKRATEAWRAFKAS